MTTPARTVLLRGFRPFFAGAVIFSLIVMTLWPYLYLHASTTVAAGLSASQWHAHEMIFGYAMAVIAGFLLTAAQNWTGVATLHGPALGALFGFWLAARLCLAPAFANSDLAGFADITFQLALLLAIAGPVLKVRQMRQAPVLLILLLLLAANGVFYLGLAGVAPEGVNLGIRAGFYLVLGLILFMGRRVIPFFTEGGTGRRLEIRRPRWIDVAMYVLYPTFLIQRVFFPATSVELTAASLCLVTGVQLCTWHTADIWKKPLLWSLYVSFAMISVGFGLLALARFLDISDNLPIHAFALGGIGIVTSSMMVRVSLGHTGRNIHESPFMINIALALLILATLARVFGPLVHPRWYSGWIWLAGMSWSIAFVCLAIALLPMLFAPRADGKPG